MPRIPNFGNQNRLSLNVPSEQAAPVSKVGDILTNLGGQAAEFGMELEKRRKAAADRRDSTQKSLDLKREWLDTSTELKLARRPDGTLNPDRVGYKDPEKETPFTYTDKVEEFWGERMNSYSEMAASPESKAQFLSQMRPLQEDSILKADAETRTMEAAATIEGVNKTIKSYKNDILILPEVTFKDVKSSVATVRDLNKKLWDEDRVLSEQDYFERDNKINNEMAVVTLDNFFRNERPEDMEALLYAGNLPEGFEDRASKLDLMNLEEGKKQLRKEYAGAPEKEVERVIEQFERQMDIDTENRLRFRGEDDPSNKDVQAISSALTSKQIESYMRRAKKLKKNKILDGIKKARSEMNDIIKRMRNDSIDSSSPEEREMHDRVVHNFTRTSQPSKDTDSAFAYNKVMLEKVRENVLMDFRKDFMFSTPEEIDARLAAFEENPRNIMPEFLEEYERLRREAPDSDLRKEYSSAKEELANDFQNGSQYLNLAFEQTVAKGRAYQSKFRASILKDPGGTFDAQFAQGDPQYLKPGEKRISKMNEMFEAKKVGPHYRRYVSEAQTADFKLQYDKAPTTQDKAEVLLATREQWGSFENWLKVAPQYLEESGIPKSLRLATIMPNVDSVQSLIGVLGEGQPQAIEQTFKNRHPNGDPALFQMAVQENEKVQSFIEAMVSSSGSTLDTVQLESDIFSAMKLYAMNTYNKESGETFGDSAAERSAEVAAQELIDKNFNVVSTGESTIYAPKMPPVRAPMGRQMQVPTREELVGFLDLNEDPAKLKKIAQAPPEFNTIAAEYLAMDEYTSTQDKWELALEDHAYWSTTPGMDGVALRFRPQTDAQFNNDPQSPYSGFVTDKNGDIIVVPWSDIANNPAYDLGVR